jgi:hypothetical protein
MNYFNNIPPEIYKEILFLLDSKAVVNVFCVNKYTLNILDDIFFQEYIKRNILESFGALEKPKHLTYVQFLNVLNIGRTISCEVCDIFALDTIIKFNLNVSFTDKLNLIRKKIYNLSRDKFEFFCVWKIILIAKINNENIALILNDNDKDNFISEFKIPKYLLKASLELDTKLHFTTKGELLSSALSIREILADELFYFNIFKILVHLSCVD